MVLQPLRRAPRLWAHAGVGFVDGQERLAEVGRGKGWRNGRQRAMAENTGNPRRLRAGRNAPPGATAAQRARGHSQRKNAAEPPGPGPIRGSRCRCRASPPAAAGWEGAQPGACSAGPNHRRSAPGGQAAAARWRPTAPEIPPAQVSARWYRRPTAWCIGTGEPRWHPVHAAQAPQPLWWESAASAPPAPAAAPPSRCWRVRKSR
jgi:hypothetical protein